jgi:hypothetical protein
MKEVHVLVRHRLLSAVVAATVLAGVLSTTSSAEAAQTLTLAAVADTTYTQVSLDGANGSKTTLATCPALCDGNSQGERDAFVEFAVTGLPAGARVTHATRACAGCGSGAVTMSVICAAAGLG